MDSESSQTGALVVIFIFFVLPSLFAFLSRVRRLKMQRERDAALSEAAQLKEKYGLIEDVEAEAQSIRNSAHVIKKMPKRARLTSKISVLHLLSRRRVRLNF